MSWFETWMTTCYRAGQASGHETSSKGASWSRLGERSNRGDFVNADMNRHE
jgi:hypothetical protein